MRPRKDYGCPLRIYADDSYSSTYTILPPRSENARQRFGLAGTRFWNAVFITGRSVSDTAVYAGPHLGKRITWAELPAAVQRFVRLSEFGEYCPKGDT